MPHTWTRPSSAEGVTGSSWFFWWLRCWLAFSSSAVPSVARWLGSDLSVKRSELRLANVATRDVVREVAVEGRVVAASHPTVFAPQRGIVSLVVQAGELVAAGQELARNRARTRK